MLQLLTFQIGAYLLAVPAQRVLAVSRESSKAAGPDPAAKRVDLAAIIDPGGQRAGQRPLIRFSAAAGVIELLVDRILALEHCADDTIQSWPALLKPLPLFLGAAVIDGRVFQLIDIDKLTAPGKGRRQ